ncbi:hypothetical protein [Pseudomonas triticicola]|uniref:hypothetical protein n=1 Tax=Pseudomonas triticicola TaxID=2842345 RepID=UPI003EB749EC
MFANEKLLALRKPLLVDKSLATRLFLPSVLPLGITAFYTVPALISFLIGSDPKASVVLLLSLACTVLYLFFWVSRIDVLMFDFIYSCRKKYLGLRKLAWWVFSSYFVLMAYVSYTAPSIPLFDSVKGMDIQTIADGRETFLRARVGVEVVLSYLYSMFRSFLMPFAVCILYQTESRLRHAVLLTFLLSLMLTLEKSLSVLALLPLFYLFTQKRNYRMAAILLLVTVTAIATTSFLARGGLADYPHTAGAAVQVGAGEGSGKNAKDLRQSAHTVPAKYNMFSGNSQVEYVLNRVFYIPYITAHEWLRYQHEVMNGEFTLGRSISIIAAVLGEKKISLEKEVFGFQWGQNETSTGSANTAYFIDAYLNFGFAGCLLYTLVIVCILRLAIMSDIAILQACVFVPLIFLLFNSLTAMIFSGGLFVLVFLALFISGVHPPSASQSHKCPASCIG